MPDKRVQLQIDTNKEFIKALKLIAVSNDKSLRQVVIEAIIEKYPQLKELA